MPPLPYCIGCRNLATQCACKAKPRGQDVSFALEDKPGSLSDDEKLARWVSLVQLQPLTRQLGAERFIADFKSNGLIMAFHRLLPKLTSMAAEYDLKGPDRQPLLATLNKFGSYTEQQLRRDVEEAMASFASFNWTTLTVYGLSMVNNAFQSSLTLQPEKYPRSDPDLAMAQQVLNVLIAVNDLASQRMEYSLECNLVLTD